ncbi:Proteasome ATPase protein [Dioscorea alata]|uniref:Proteasome ATPase protein n=1 Tax=Dioscorea alata TaxID=55571 RepID=A0ACB7V270_DIOAL|nr:Proteasome ATPase protein [Dioscorea alata]
MDFEKGYQTDVKKLETDFDFYKWQTMVHSDIWLTCLCIYHPIQFIVDFTLVKFSQ